MVKCQDCGFLALRQHRTQELIRAEKPYRTEGRIVVSMADPRYEAAERMPVCAEDKIDFFDVLQSRKTYSPPATVTPDEIVGMLGEERECHTWVQFNQLLTPKEHREMLDRQWMYEQEEKRITEDRKWRSNERMWTHIWHVIDLLVLGVMVATATIVAGAVSRGWAPGWWPW
jgi:hypothetical protein